MKTITLILIMVGLLIIAGIIGGFCYLSNRPYKEINNTEINQFSLASGVVPHHEIAKEIIEDFFEYILSKGEPETIILLSPDHFDSGNLTESQSFISIEVGTKEFNELEVNNSLLNKLSKETKIALNTHLVKAEHGITTLLGYIKGNFQNTKILPIIIPSDITKEQIDHFVELIDSYVSPQTMIIASVDFSHYLPERAADFHDVKSIRTLLIFEKEDFENLEVDCWQCLYGARLFARLRQQEFPQIIAHKNSVDFLKIDAKETTSYFSVVFEEENLNKEKLEGKSILYQEEISNAKTILFVGDIMLDRGVEYLMNKNSIFYPFNKISNFLRGIDIVFANLEGPIVKNPKEFPDSSLKFAFSSEVIKGLSFGNFNLLSLANNHSLDMGKNGLKETKELLKENNIDFVGDTISCSQDFSFQKEEIIFLAINKTFPFNCKDEEIIETVKLVKSSNPDKFFIVSFHWGQEYQLNNSLFQQELAHKVIEAGADLIVGHHPHVVQGIEEYKGKLIFYSLGNFIFDQFFSQETQQGLAVGLEIYPQRVIYRLFPFKIHLAQPQLMESEKEIQFLESLAQRSDSELFDKIKEGIIEIESLK